MSKDAILTLEDVVGFVPCGHVVTVPVDGVGASQVTVLSDALLTVADLFIEQTRHNVLRVDVRLSSNNIVLDRAPIIKGLGTNGRQNTGSTARRLRSIAPLTSRNLICLLGFPFKLLIQPYLFFIRHPRIGALDIG